jgi:SAM-dependent methyltransferase
LTTAVTPQASPQGDRRWLDLALPADLRGKSVLDVGTGEGSLCLEAIARGASRAVGLDVDDVSLARASAATEATAAPVEFRRVNVEAYEPDGPFDYVVCRGALRRVRNPFLLLERLIDLTRERLVLEVPEIGQREQKALGLRRWRRLLLRGFGAVPLVLVGRRPVRGDRQRFYLTPDAVRCLLREHRSVFARVDVVPSTVAGRSILVARRRHIDRLIAIAGPTSAGKSTLIEGLAHGRHPDIAVRLGIGDRATWEPLGVYDIAGDERPRLSTVVMHYDFLSRLRQHDQHVEPAALLDVLGCARDITVVTLWTEPARLHEQFEENEIRAYVRQRGVEPTNPKTLQLRRDYQDPQTVVNYYRTWLRFVSTIPGDHLVLSQGPRPSLVTIDEWLREHGSARDSHTPAGA